MESKRTEWIRTIVFLLALVMIGYTVWHQSAITDCQADFNVAYANGLLERTKAAASEREAQRVMLDALLNPHATSTDRAAALVTWRTQLIEADQVRENAPIPVDPRCG